MIADVNADVLAVVEAEDRPALVRFNRDVLPTATRNGAAAPTYRHVMLVDGNDNRGIDVGLFTRDQLDLQPRRRPRNQRRAAV